MGVITFAAPRVGDGVYATGAAWLVEHCPAVMTQLLLLLLQLQLQLQLLTHGTLAHRPDATCLRLPHSLFFCLAAFKGRSLIYPLEIGLPLTGSLWSKFSVFCRDTLDLIFSFPWWAWSAVEAARYNKKLQVGSAAALVWVSALSLGAEGMGRMMSR